jgi:hypothetical protein
MQTRSIVDFSHKASIFHLAQDELESEWKILHRLDGDLSTGDKSMMLRTIEDKRAMFPAFSTLAHKVLLVPTGTAGVECSFSTMNRILSSDRCALLPNHVDILMQVSIKGPTVPDVRDGTEMQDEKLCNLIGNAMTAWKRMIYRE